MKQMHFFALKDDILAMLNLVENRGPLTYVLTGNFPSPELKDGIRAIYAGAEIPNLGNAAGDSSAICDAYLVCERETPINLRHLDDVEGSERVCVDQLANPDSVVFLPAGAWDGHSVIQGHVGTASDSPIAKLIMKRFETAVKKLFVKIKAFHVGPNALRSLESGERLTSSVRSPREFDLTLPA